MNVQQQQQQQHNQSNAKVLSFDDISKYFSLPLSDAASNLGVCVSVLKKICRDNGLDRWPYRKFLAGKSIEEIKRHAAREKAKERIALAKALRQSGSEYQNNDVSKLQGISSPPRKLPQPGSKEIQIGRPQVLTKGMSTLDEFKHGFPSDGLSSVTYKWWGSSSPQRDEGIDSSEAKSDELEKPQSEGKADTGASSVKMDEEKPGKGGVKVHSGLEGTGLLTAVRKKAAEEGRETLKLHVRRKYGVNKLGRKDRRLLIRIFDSSLPKGWINGL
ncbi:protein NLP3-like [Tripterygium wilfordii]|uniref:Protein NLP3-like n=1 Tax=Tripterygium wilfordii TaxID=458696 RepID=A0A7J7CEC9_TRIWF|nr:uncharacterized protein LOC119982336 [Tripterygium wilfordii]KAF5732498.1 protein NLP3-like [Tripterygium wilfordii]